MSTSYFMLAEPVTGIEITEAETINDMHWTRIDISGRFVGSLLLFKDDMPQFIRLFADRDRLAARTVGVGNGKVSVGVSDESLPDDTVLISEYGDVVTLANVKAKDTDSAPKIDWQKEYEELHRAIGIRHPDFLRYYDAAKKTEKRHEKHS